MTTARRLAHLGISVAVLAAIVALPLALVRGVGWPLPTVVPGGTQIGLALRSADIPDMVIIKALACVVWLAWADLILAFAWELFVNHPHLARGHAPQSPVVVNRWMAGLATYVIAGLLTVASVAGPANATPLPSTPSAPRLAPETAPPLLAPLSPRETVHDTQPRVAQPGAGDPTWTTQRGDTLWNIAEVTTGDPNRFGEILALNTDQLTRPRDLRPGMVLRLPPAAQVPDNRARPPVAPGPVMTHVVQPGESEWSIARDERPGKPADVVAPLWADIVATNASSVADPNLVYPGETLLVPQAPTPTASAPPPVAPPAAAPVPKAPAPDVASATPLVPSPPPASAPGAPVPAPPLDASASATASAPVTAAPDPARTTPPATSLAARNAPASTDNDLGSVVGAGGILLGAGVSAELLRRRRRGMARRRYGERPAPIPPHLDQVARSVLGSPIDDARWLAAELRLVCAAVPEASRCGFGVTVVQYNPQQSIEIALVTPIPDPPAGWEAHAGGLVWALSDPHDEADLTAALDLPPALPALVTVGDPAEDKTLLNIEQAGLIGIDGDPHMMAGLVRSLVWELATTPLCEHVDLIGLGVGVAGAATLEHWSTVADPDELVAELAVAARQTAALIPNGQNPVSVRCGGREAVVPTVALVAAERATSHVLDAVAPGVVVIIVGAVPDGALEVRVADGQVVVPALGLICPARQLSAEAAAAMGEVLECSAVAPISISTATSPPQNASTTVPRPVGPSTDETAEHTDSADPWAWLPPEPRVWLSVLGPVGARGAELTHQQIAALTYLALHPDPAPTTAQMKDAVWGGVAPTPKRWRDFLYALRRAVGPDAIVSVGADGFGLGPDVGTDITLVQALLDRADSHPKERWACLERAIQQLSGVPFTIPSSAARYWRWIDAEYLDARLYARLADAADDLGRHHLTKGDPAKAKAVAELGLKALPIDSALTELLMDAYAALGSPVAAERVFDAHERALDDLGLSNASEETQAVIERIRAAHGQKPSRGVSEFAGRAR